MSKVSRKSVRPTGKSISFNGHSGPRVKNLKKKVQVFLDFLSLQDFTHILNSHTLALEKPDGVSLAFNCLQRLHLIQIISLVRTGPSWSKGHNQRFLWEVQRWKAKHKQAGVTERLERSLRALGLSLGSFPTCLLDMDSYCPVVVLFCSPYCPWVTSHPLRTFLPYVDDSVSLSPAEVPGQTCTPASHWTSPPGPRPPGTSAQHIFSCSDPGQTP